MLIVSAGMALSIEVPRRRYSRRAEVVDISVPVEPGTIVHPADPEVRLEQTASVTTAAEPCPERPGPGVRPAQQICDMIETEP
jgi:hypothetical protein